MESSNRRSKNAFLNIVFSILMQLITATSGLILPRLFIPTYGSNVNGLISSITQFLSYISLLETGVGGVIVAALYKPLSKRDELGVSGVINAAKLFYRKIAYTFIFYTIILCVVYPLVIKTDFDFWYIATLILILSIGTFFEYFFSLHCVNILTADQKARITYSVQSIMIIARIIITYICVELGAGIHTLKIISCLVFLVKPLFYSWYVKKYYSIDNKCQPNNLVIKQRWNGMVHNLAFFIHNNTDIVIITMFMDIRYASVYTVYLAIVSGIQRLVNSISQGSAAGIGNLIAIGDQSNLNRIVDSFEFIQCGVTTILFTITSIMIIPFMQIYTSGMSDFNYIQSAFANVLILSEAVYCIRSVYSTISLNGGRYKETQLGAILEAGFNIILSLFMVRVLGIVGIAIGTFCGMFVRLIFEVLYLSKHLLHRPIFKAAKNLFVNLCIALMTILLCKILLPVIVQYNIVTWILRAIIVFFITMCVASLFYLMFYKEKVFELFIMFKNIFVKK